MIAPNVIWATTTVATEPACKKGLAWVAIITAAGAQVYAFLWVNVLRGIRARSVTSARRATTTVVHIFGVIRRRWVLPFVRGSGSVPKISTIRETEPVCSMMLCFRGAAVILGPRIPSLVGR